MKHSNFVHLHVHTEYSILDSTIKIEGLLRLAQEYEMPAVAITDHHNLFGAMDFYNKAHDKYYGFKGKPIIGCEVYISGGSSRDKNKKLPHILLLLCENLVGYNNLCKLVSKSYLEEYRNAPIIDKESLTEHSEGLIALSGSITGEVPQNIIQDNFEAAKEAALFYSGLFDDGRYYLELQKTGRPGQDKANKGLMRLSKELDIPLVATNDCHYLKKEDAYAHEVLMCLESGKTMADESRYRLASDQFYFKSPEEMAELFSFCPEAIENTVKIADRCNLKFEGFSDYKYKDIEKPLPDIKTIIAEDPKEHLRKLAHEGLDERLKKVKEKYHDDYPEKEKVYRERLDYELEIITSLGHEDYFLIVADYVNFAKKNSIRVGPGHGAVGGSLVAYCLKITEVDPIEYGLIFERFLNPLKDTEPDIDIDVDFCIKRRNEVLQYISQKYGEDNVAQIINFDRLGGTLAIRSIGSALNISKEDIKKIVNTASDKWDCLYIDMLMKNNPTLDKMVEERSEIKEFMKVAKSLSELCLDSSTHCSGIVIAGEPLASLLPLSRVRLSSLSNHYRNAYSDDLTDLENKVMKFYFRESSSSPEESINITQYSAQYIEKIGLNKFDLLELDTLTIIDEALKNIKAKSGDNIDINNIPLDDKKTFELFCRGDTDDIFQFEDSEGMRELTQRLIPGSFNDIVALISLYRPGPLQSGMADDFIERKNNKLKTVGKDTLPQVEEILRETYGFIVYQEQVMQIAYEAAGFSFAEADIFRRVLGRHEPNALKEQEKKFIDGAMVHGVKESKAKEVFEFIERFSAYGFNKSHSVAYALIAYQTAYLKANYFEEFMAAVEKVNKNNKGVYCV